MNENPGGTPNPLNPNPLDANPAEPMQPQMGQPAPIQPEPMPTPAAPARPQAAPVRPTRPMRTMRAARQARVAEAPQPVSAPTPIDVTETVGAAGTVQPVGDELSMITEEVVGTKVESLDPTGRPMEQAPVFADKPKKKRVWPIIIAVILALALIGGGIAAAIILLNQNKGDAVTAAMTKIMSGDAPANVAVEGTIEMRSNSDYSPIETVKIDLNSDIVRNSMVNTSSAVVTLSIRDMDDISFEFDEVYAESGDLYLKLDGASDALQSSGLLQLLGGATTLTQTVVDCDTEDGTQCVTMLDTEQTLSETEELQVDCIGPDGTDYCNNATEVDLLGSLSAVLGIIDTIDGEWLRISTAEMELLTQGGMLPESQVTCITNLVSDINTDSSSAAELYAKYPFVSSSSENVTVAKKHDPIYRVSIDSANLANFIDAIQNSQLSNDIYSCLGLENNVSISTEDIEEIVAEFPKIYAEVDEDYNFTRLYLESENDGASMTTIIDLSFKYPSGLNVDEPNDYMDFSEVLQEIFSSMYDLDEGEVVEETETVEVGQ